MAAVAAAAAGSVAFAPFGVALVDRGEAGGVLAVAAVVGIVAFAVGGTFVVAFVYNSKDDTTQFHTLSIRTNSYA